MHRVALSTSALGHHLPNFMWNSSVKALIPKLLNLFENEKQIQAMDLIKDPLFCKPCIFIIEINQVIFQIWEGRTRKELLDGPIYPYVSPRKGEMLKPPV